MKQFTIKLANKIVCVNALFNSTQGYCQAYLSKGSPDFSVTIEPKDIEFEKKALLKIGEKEEGPMYNRSDNYLETIALQRKISEKFLNHNILLFHGSTVSVDGVAYLFTATSGTGKSTHTRLWREMLGDRAVMVNDDKPFVSVDGDLVIVHGSPWNGKHKIGNNISVPLRAICILERGERNEIKEIPASQALRMLIQQSSRPRRPELMAKYMELLDGVARGVRFYCLSCNMDPEAAHISYEAMSAVSPRNI